MTHSDVTSLLVRPDGVIPKARYTSRAFVDLEMDRLWSRVWQVACREEELAQPGDYVEYTIGDQAILFEGTGDTLYLNRPAGGCSGLAEGRALVVRTTISQLCRGDIVTVLDPVSGVEYGGCGLGDFVPYRRTP